jgi:predicted nucleotidyltransferase
VEQLQTLAPPRPLPEDLVEQTAAAVAALAERHSWRLVVLFGSAATGGQARDLDLAVLPAAPPGLLEQGAWQAALEGALAPWSVDLLVLGDWTSPVTRFQVFCAGRCLFESEPGLFAREQDRAFFLHADSESIRRQMREVLHAKPGS